MTEIPALSEIVIAPYLDQLGDISAEYIGKIGVYAIFDRDLILQYVGISRDIATSLRLHIVRAPDLCYWVKVTTVEKPSRTFLSEIQTAWLAGQTVDAELWEQPLDCRKLMTDREKLDLTKTLGEVEEEKVLKNVARRVEKEVLELLAARGVKFDVRFNPKFKSSGILDVK